MFVLFKGMVGTIETNGDMYGWTVYMDGFNKWWTIYKDGCVIY